MSKKNEKVFVIKACLNNGHARTVNVIAPIKTTLADVCRMKNIPMLSIISVKVSEPMSANEADTCFLNEMLAVFTAPNTDLISCSLSLEAA